jgi:hypothetical protein
MMLSLFRVTGDWDEVLFLPLMMLPIVEILGTLDGFVGKSLGRVSRSSVKPWEPITTRPRGGAFGPLERLGSIFHVWFLAKVTR